MARTLITKFFQDGVITDDEIKLMQDEIYSKRTFNLNFAVLKKVDKNIELKTKIQQFHWSLLLLYYFYSSFH